MSSNPMIDGSILLEHLNKRANSLGLKQNNTFDPEPFRVTAGAALSEVMTLKMLVKELMKSSQSQ